MIKLLSMLHLIIVKPVFVLKRVLVLAAHFTTSQRGGGGRSVMHKVIPVFAIQLWCR